MMHIDPELGMRRLKDVAFHTYGQIPTEIATLEARLQRNLRENRMFGDDPANRAEWTRIMFECIRVSQEMLGLDFNELCQSTTGVRAKPEQRLASFPPHSQNAPTRSVDIGIIIALQEEFDVFFPTIQQAFTPEVDPDSGRHFFLFRGNGTRHVYSCVVSLLGGMGHTDTAIMTESMLRLYQPRTIVMLGIAAGIHDDVRIGDVIVANSVDSYIDRGKIKSDEQLHSSSIQFSGQVYQCSADLLHFLQAFKYTHAHAYQQWCQSGSRTMKQLDNTMREELEAKGFLRFPITYQIGPLASGPLVVASSTFKNQLQQRNRSFLGIEMEAGGMMAVLHELIAGKRSLILRGVSDYGDERKKDLDTIKGNILRHYAMHNAVQLFWQLLGAEAFPLQ